jgi:hypothetical protein
MARGRNLGKRFAVAARAFRRVEAGNRQALPDRAVVALALRCRMPIALPKTMVAAIDAPLAAS